MKKTLLPSTAFITTLFVLFFLVGWKKDNKTIRNRPFFTRQLISDTYIAGTCTGGKIEISVWGDYIDGQTNVKTVSVDAGFVMVGGGAKITNTLNTDVGVNSLLTAAYPVDNGLFTTYSGASKSHQVQNLHRLWVYVIGMKIFPCNVNQCAGGSMNTSQIISNMKITSVTSSPAVSFPTIVVNPPAGYTFLSGGAFDHWSGQGNLLVGNGWQTSLAGDYTSGGKDCQVVSTATITGYCISIKLPLTCVLPVNLTITSKFNTASIISALQSITVTADPGNLIAGVSGLSTYVAGGQGRYLWAMAPTSTTAGIVSSKDHIQPDVNGTIGIGITQIKPNF
ncbi:MAG TPA: hypothetical protein VK543_09255 [Puia sp.]|nr:hypothetical protein [Puia sp.]